ncbi:MAG: hypothetical protein K2Q12_07975 [Rickettsiales bacterium]|nr:hypothetical protein [Rickettsiales bacterium]
MTIKILKSLNAKPKGLTLFRIQRELEAMKHAATEQSVKANLQRLIVAGKIRRDESLNCDECGHPHRVYRITALGKQHYQGES